MVNADGRSWAASRIYSQKETAIAECSYYCRVQVFDCGSRNSRTFNFVVITKSYSAGKITMTVLCVDEVLAEFLRIGASRFASVSSARWSSTK